MTSDYLNNKHRGALRVSLVLIVILITLSCANRYIKTPGGGSTETVNLLGNNPFERSLDEARDELDRVELIEYFIMYELLKELAEHDGPNSPRHGFLREIQEKHILDDSTEVMAIFNRGLMDLDENRSENNRKNWFIETEVPKRAEQIAANNCFHFPAKNNFDELGRLIMRLGVFTLESWDEDTKTVWFSNGAYYVIGDDLSDGHIILDAAGSREGLEVQAAHESRVFKMKQEGKVSVDIDYDKLEFSNINIHLIPCSFGDGRWNGKSPSGDEGPWQWSRAFLDFYLNLENIDPEKTEQGQKIEFDIGYEIHRTAADSSGKVAGETLHYRREFRNLNKSDGLFFRVFTAPFYTGDDTARGDYRLNLKVTGSGKKLIKNYPFSVYDKQYELLVLDSALSTASGIPLCRRIPTAKRGERLDILMPVKDLPADEQSGRYTARVNFYLVNNEDFREGQVIVDSLKFYKIIDSTDSLPPVHTYPENNFFTPKSLIASFDIDVTAPDDYLVYSLEIPEKWADNTKVKRGRYTLAAAVTHNNQTIGEATVNDLRIK